MAEEVFDPQRLHTSCRDCRFARYDRSCQTGCDLGRLERFAASGATVVEARDDEREFSVIDGRACLAWRPADWGENLTPQARRETVRREMTIRLEYLIWVETTSSDALRRTVASLKDQQPAHHRVTFCLLQGAAHPRKVFHLLEQSGLTGWHVRTFPNGANRGQAADITLQSTDSSWYACFRAGTAVPDGYAARLDAALNDRLERFVVLEGLDGGCGDGFAAQTFLHRALGGNAEAESTEAYGPSRRLDGLLEKVRFVAADQGLDHLIRSVVSLEG
jgi:hypothetical protein